MFSLTAKLYAAAGLALALLLGAWAIVHSLEARGAAQCKADVAAAEVKAQAEYRALEQQMQAVKDQAQHDYSIAQTRNASSLAVARSNADKLRSQLATYASVTPSDSAASASGRTAAVGSVLADVLQDLADRTRDAEANADSYRALRLAWPGSSAIALPSLKLGQP